MSAAEKRVLVVDDEESLRVTLVAMLELEGFEIVEADSAERAIELLDEGDFDLVLSDIRMPGLSGIDLFQHIKEAQPAIPVVLMTAFTLEEQVDGAMRDGVFTVLSKPFDIDDAVETLMRALSSPVVLIVDDAQDDAESTAEALRARSVKAKAVYDGASALEAIRERSVDVCVTELELPDLDGATLLDEIRAIDPTVIVIAISGMAVPEVLEEAASKGAYQFMRKPLDVGTLLTIIGRARGSRQAASG